MSPWALQGPGKPQPPDLGSEPVLQGITLRQHSGASRVGRPVRKQQA